MLGGYNLFQRARDGDGGRLGAIEIFGLVEQPGRQVHSGAIGVAAFLHMAILASIEAIVDCGHGSVLRLCVMARMSQVGVREVRQNLSVYLDRVKAGESLEITEHGRPVAILVPTEDAVSPLRRLIAEGRARPAPRRWLRVPRPVTAAKVRGMRPLGEVLRELDADTL